MYFRNSHASRLLPIPPWPGDRHEPGLPLAGGCMEEVLAAAAAPRLGRRRALRGLRSGSGHRARRRLLVRAMRAPAIPCPERLLPASSKAIAPAVARWVASPTSTTPGGATDCSRLAVFTRSPATIPWFVAPSVTVASPVSTPARASRPRPSHGSSDGGDQVQRGAHGALGVVLLGDRRTPHGHDGVADELLDRAAVALDDPLPGRSSGSGGRERPPSRGPRKRGEADQVGEQDAHEPIARRRSRHCVLPACSPSSALWPGLRVTPVTVGGRRAPSGSRVAHSVQNLADGGFVVPQFGHAADSGVAHSVQNFAPGRFSVPQVGQITVGGYAAGAKSTLRPRMPSRGALLRRRSSRAPSQVTEPTALCFAQPACGRPGRRRAGHPRVRRWSEPRARRRRPAHPGVRLP